MKIELISLGIILAFVGTCATTQTVKHKKHHRVALHSVHATPTPEVVFVPVPIVPTDTYTYQSSNSTPTKTPIPPEL